MFSDVLTIKEAFLEYKDVSFSKSKKSDFVAPQRFRPEGEIPKRHSSNLRVY